MPIHVPLRYIKQCFNPIINYKVIFLPNLRRIIKLQKLTTNCNKKKVADTHKKNKFD